MNDEQQPIQPGTVVTPDGVASAPIANEADLAGGEMMDNELTEVEMSEGDLPVVQWQAHEYIQHDKTALWYMVLAVIFAGLVAIAFITKEWLSIGVFAVMGIAIVVYGRRPPRNLSYTLDDQGIHIEDKTYPYEQFSSFGVLQDATWRTIDLEPTRRFMPRLSLLFDDANLDAIVDRLEAELPRLDRTPDLVERITHSIKF